MIHRCVFQTDYVSSELNTNLLFLKANSSSDCFLSGLRFGRSFFTLLGLLLRSCKFKGEKGDGPLEYEHKGKKIRLDFNYKVHVTQFRIYASSVARFKIVTWTSTQEKSMNMVPVR